MRYIVLCLMLAPAMLLGQFSVSLDWAVFQYDENQNLVEIYFGFPQTDMTYSLENELYSAYTFGRFLAYVGDSLAYESAWKNVSSVADTAEIQKDKQIIDRVAFAMMAGRYECYLILQDLNKKSRIDTVQWSMNLNAPINDRPVLSEIELATSIQMNAQDKESPFYKNTLQVVPNPGLIYGMDTPALFFYLEAYNLTLAPLSGGYKLHYFVSDVNKQPLPTLEKTVSKSTIVDPSVEFGVLNVGTLEAGAYLLNVEIQDQAGHRIADKSKKFFVYQQGSTKNFDDITQELVVPNIFSHMDSVKIEHEFMSASYLMSSESKKLWEQIQNLQGKKEFLYRFWLGLDPDKETPVNEFYPVYRERVTYTNKNFNAFKMKGWKTDRGRVYLVYGPPDDIERHPNEQSYHPYEIWYYNEMQSGVKFVFCDFDGHGNYRLLHSDLLGEIQDYNYMEQIRKGF